ncbi:bifunctional nuclease family protein [Nesterenkonia populi]|uniref:bifunctional nuclease family protein n=1 Tax=Nesterenkonia populi TaxID=1591087 RepID=UPI0011BF2B65|nr:bifunctional nuclease family protein [Nesterenkonia populi]
MEDRPSDQVLMDVVGVRVELPSNQPVIILHAADRAAEGRQHVAVVVGPAEAAAVARALQGEIPPRPMTHDLLANVLETLGGGVARVEISLMDSATYRGTLTLGSGKALDARASDAIAVAVRAKCPLTMQRSTLRTVAVTPRRSGGEEAVTGPGVNHEAESVLNKSPISEDEIAEFQKFLDEADPDDFGGTGGADPNS